MADADGRIIPWVEDDQGEGIKDFLEEYMEASRKSDQEILKHISGQFEALEKKEG